MNRIAILGPGAIGGLLAGLFSRKGHEVSCVGKPETVAAIAQNGIQIESPVFGNFVARPEAKVKLTEPVDLVFVTTKAPFLKESIERIDAERIGSAIIISLLNGLGHRDVLRARFGPRVVIGTIGLVEVAKGRDGIIRQLSRQNPHIDLGSDGDVSGESLSAVAAVIQGAGISASVVRNEAEVIWKKLVRLNAIASLTAAFQMPLGPIRSDPEMKSLLRRIVMEGALVAAAEGAQIVPEEVLRQIESLPETLTTSLQRDVHAHAAGEVDSITGGVLRCAKFHGIPVPAHEQVYDLIRRRIDAPREMEATRLT